MGSNVSRSCQVFSIESSSTKKPALYVSPKDRIISMQEQRYLLDVILHGQPTEADLRLIWQDLDSSKRGYIDLEECEGLIKEITQSMAVYLQLQVKEGVEAIDILVDKAAAHKGGYTPRMIDEEKKQLKQNFTTKVIVPNAERFDRIDAQKDRNVKPLAEDLAQALKQFGPITQEVFVAHFCEKLGAVFAKHDIEILLSTDTFFPFGKPSLNPPLSSPPPAPSPVASPPPATPPPIPQPSAQQRAMTNALAAPVPAPAQAKA